MTDSSNRWNQWRQKELRHGKTDDDQLNYLVKYLQITHNINPALIKKDWYILFDFDTYRTVKITRDVLTSDVEGPQKVVIRHPDIMILNKKDQSVHFIIELDGKYHSTKIGAKKTAKRNSDYHFANIKTIIVNTEDLKYLHKSWAEYLDEELQMFDLVKSR